ncbi:MAG: VanW family protein [Armatimonadota bacterium]
MRLVFVAAAVGFGMACAALLARQSFVAPQNLAEGLREPLESGVTVAANLPDSILLTDGVKAWRASLEKLGVNRQMRSFDPNAAKSYLERLAPLVAYPGVNASLLVAKDGTVTITRSQMARRLDVPKTVEKLQRFLENPPTDSTLHMVLEKTKPEISTEDLQGINGRLASFTTRFNPGDRARSHNLRLVAKKLDRTFIPPNGIFSFNERVGPRDGESGYRKAKIYLNGRIAEGIGGGTCQVSGTLYNAALLAGLTPVVRSHHSMTVAYLPPGRDATVNYGSIDLKLRNDTGGPVYIRSSAGVSRLTVSVYGVKRPGRSVVVYSRARWSKGRLIAKTYRVVKQDGKVLAKELISVDSYKPKPPEERRKTAAKKIFSAKRRSFPLVRTVSHVKPVPSSINAGKRGENLPQ